MKQVLRKVTTPIERLTVELKNSDYPMVANYFKTTIITPEMPCLPCDLVLFQKVAVAENLNEFRELHNLTEEALVEWLNLNYESK